MSKSKQKQAEIQAADNGESKEVAKKADSIKDLLSGETLERYERLDVWNKQLDRDPPSKWVKTNKFSNNAKYLPIRIVETLLTSLYGAYQTEMIHEPKRILNSVVVSVHLKVYHPVLEEWLTYAGTGAVPIETPKGSGMTAEEIREKALHKNVPAAKAFAVSNAAKGIGRIFGSHLNNGADEQIAHRSTYAQQKSDQ